MIIPQRLLGVTPDGVVGQQTITTLNKQDPAAFFNKIRAERVAFLEGIVQRDPSQRVFLRGWLNRLNDLKYTV